MSKTVFKIINPETGKIICVGITERKANAIIEDICAGTANDLINQRINRLLKKGLSPKCVISPCGVAEKHIDKAMKALAMLLGTIYLPVGKE